MAAGWPPIPTQTNTLPTRRYRTKFKRHPPAAYSAQKVRIDILGSAASAAAAVVAAAAAAAAAAGASAPDGSGIAAIFAVTLLASEAADDIAGKVGLSWLLGLGAAALERTSRPE